MSNAATPQPTYELKNDLDLSKFLLGAIRDVRKGELDLEKAQTLSQLADKYAKVEMVRILKAKLTGDIEQFNLEGKAAQLMIQKAE